MDKLQQEYDGKDRSRLFESCKLYLTGAGGAPSDAEIGQKLEMSEAAVRVAVHRMRQRYREMLRTEVAQTVEQTEAVNDELEYLRSTIQGKKR